MFANNLSWIDWAIVASFLMIATVTVIVASRLMRSVADFLAAGRCARRYLLTVAGLAMGTGATSAVANWEATYKVGFGPMWWGNILMPVYLIMSLSAWVGYRFRETRALTVAQFFEVRYSRKFRVFAGLLAYVSGVINYGIFPAIAARFIFYFCGFTEHLYFLHLPIIGPCAFPCVFATILLLSTAFSLFVTLGGGQVAIMVSDFVQGMLFLIVGVVLAIWCLHTFSWNEINHMILSVGEPGHNSMINPFHGSGVKDFNVWYWLILAFSAFYNARAWQGASGFGPAAKSAHESRMAGLIATWRNGRWR